MNMTNEVLLNEDENLKKTFNDLLISKHELYETLKAVKEDKVKVKRVVKCCSFIVKWDCQVNLTRCKGTLANMSRILDSVSKRKRR